jgi:hypothetical protein
MFDPNSRYAKIQTASLTAADGREISYVRRRFLPRSEDMPTLAEIAITQKDRLDLLTSRTLGDPEQFWRVCDASNAVNPPDLTSQIGRTIRIPVPQPQ